MNNWIMSGTLTLASQIALQGWRALVDLRNATGDAVPSEHIFSFLFLSIAFLFILIGIHTGSLNQSRPT